MNLSANDFADRELSIDELEAIAAGGFFGDAWKFVKHEAHVVGHFLAKPAVYTTLATVGLTIFGGWANQKLN